MYIRKNLGVNSYGLKQEFSNRLLFWALIPWHICFLDDCAIFRKWSLASTSGLPLQVMSCFPGPQLYANLLPHSLAAITIRTSYHGNFKLSGLMSQNKILPSVIISAMYFVHSDITDKSGISSFKYAIRIFHFLEIDLYNIRYGCQLTVNHKYLIYLHWKTLLSYAPHFSLISLFQNI